MGEVVETVIGIAVFILFGIPVISFALTAATTAIALQVAIAVAIAGYLLGIPWSIWFRVRHGRWPSAD
jgi:hypothetical protein